MLLPRISLLLLSICVFVLSGCTPDNGMLDISGKVTMDGEPVPSGTISFMPVSGQGTTSGGEIIDGEYTAEVSPGELAVQVTSPQEVRKENPTAEEVERGLDVDRKETIPPKYNRASVLRITVAADALEHDITMTSKD